MLPDNYASGRPDHYAQGEIERPDGERTKRLKERLHKRSGGRHSVEPRSTAHQGHDWFINHEEIHAGEASHRSLLAGKRTQLKAVKAAMGGSAGSTL